MEDRKSIAYQNKDIMSKYFSDEFKGKSFEAYGINLPPIVDSLPTELAAVEANELRLDRLFKLQDGSYMIVDYESDYNEAKKSKYLSYIARLAKTLYNKLKFYPNMRVLIIYTADVTRKQTKPYLNLGDFTMLVEEAFLSEIDSDEIWRNVSEQVANSEIISDVNLMQLIIYPLTFKERVDKKRAIRQMIDLANGIRDERQKVFALKGLLVFCDKIIPKKDSEEIRRMLMLTKVEQIYEREKQEALEKNTREVTAKVTENVTAKVTETVTVTVTQTVTDRIATNLLRSGSDPEYVASNTGLTLEKVLQLKDNLEK